MNIYEILMEVGDKPYNVKFAGAYGKTAKYYFVTSKGIKYMVVFTKTEISDKAKGGHLIFGTVDSGKIGKQNKDLWASVRITGTGDEFRVLSTIGKIIYDYSNRFSPDYITFTAREPSRISLYNKIVKNIDKYIPGWRKWKIVDEYVDTFYMIQKK
jgi:hypothetical protein